MKPSVYGLVRCCAALTGTALLALVVILLAIVFYGQMFHWYDWSSLLLPTFLTLVPPLIFALGSGWRLGRLSAWLLFVWMLVPILLMTLPLPEFLGLLNGNVFVERPLTLNILDPAFSLSIGTVITQCVLLLTGILFLVVSPTKSKKHWDYPPAAKEKSRLSLCTYANEWQLKRTRRLSGCIPCPFYEIRKYTYWGKDKTKGAEK